MKSDLKTRLEGDLLYFISYGLFLVPSILSTSFFYKDFAGDIYNRIQTLGFVLLVLYEFMSNGKRQYWRGLLVCLALLILTIRISQPGTQYQIVLMFAYIYCARNIPFAKIARFSLNVSIVVVLTVVLSSYFGVIQNISAMKNGRIRDYMGFRYALFLPGLLLNMTALWVYIKKNTVSVVGALVWAAANLFVYLRTDSRISFLLAEMLLAAALFMRFCPKVTEKLKVLWVLAASSFAICAPVSLLFTVLYDGSVGWMRKLNSMLESRLRLGHASLMEHGVTFFGEQIKWLGNGLDAYGNSSVGTYSYVDCLYVKILQRYGIIFTVAFIGLICWAMYRLYKRKEYHILLICAVVAVHCVLDDLSFSMHYNTFWIAMGMVLMNGDMLNWDGKTARIPKRIE